MRNIYLVSWTDFGIHHKTVMITSLKKAKAHVKDLKEDHGYASNIKLYRCIPIEDPPKE